jgi:hypothetical protein
MYQLSPRTTNQIQCSIVDAALLYDCPYSGDKVILLIRNAIHVPNMENNLIPPFVMREAGVVVNDTPKIQIAKPLAGDHSICFPETDLRIPLALWGVFSYFPMSKPHLSKLQQLDNVYMLTPMAWDPHDPNYVQSEAAMLDCHGEMVVHPPKPHILMSTISANERLALVIGSVERCRVDEGFTFTAVAEEHKLVHVPYSTHLGLL